MEALKVLFHLIFTVSIMFSFILINADEEMEDEIAINPDDLDVSTNQYDKDGRHESNLDHEAILGSYQDADDYKELEPMEAKKRLGIHFEKIDDDKNGSISKTELFQWIIHSLIKLDAENSLRPFEEMDENHDKNITLNEYLTKSYGHSENELEKILTASKEWESFVQRINVDKQRFNLADKNNNTFLDFEEFVKFNNPDHYREMIQHTLNQTLSLIDTNHDGLIDLEEFLGEESGDNETEIYETKVFKDHDVDNNGYLNKTEIIEWKSPGLEKTAHDEVEHLFNKTDLNGDKQLTKEEVIDQHELWIGSHATDYGRHLDAMKPHDEL